MDYTIFTGQKIWCPLCKDHRPFLQVPNAARLLEADRRTIYRYIEEGRVHAFKPAAVGNYRVCSGCLLVQHSGSVEIMVQAKRTKTQDQSPKTKIL